MSLFPEDNGKAYGFFGYQSQMIHTAINSDRDDMMQEAKERGWIVPGTKTLANDTLRKFCRDKKATRCDEYLAAQGYPA
jgi:hypothetical protein